VLGGGTRPGSSSGWAEAGGDLVREVWDWIDGGKSEAGTKDTCGDNWEVLWLLVMWMLDGREGELVN